MKKLIFLTMLLSSVFLMSYGDDGKKSDKREARKEKFKNMTDEEKAEFKQKRIERITEKLKEKGKTDEEIAEILKKLENCKEKIKEKIEDYKAKLKAEGKTDEEIEKILSEKRKEFHKRFKHHHKNKKQD